VVDAYQFTDEQLMAYSHEDADEPDPWLCREVARFAVALRAENRRLAQRTQELAAELETLRYGKLPWRSRLRVWWAKQKLTARTKASSSGPTESPPRE
jgi:cell division protein FtsB